MKNFRLRLEIICPQPTGPEFGRPRFSRECSAVTKKSEISWCDTLSNNFKLRIRFNPKSIQGMVVWKVSHNKAHHARSTATVTWRTSTGMAPSGTSTSTGGTMTGTTTIGSSAFATITVSPYNYFREFCL